MSGEVPDPARAAQAAERAAAQADRAQRAAQNATQSVEDVKESTADVIKALDVKVGAGTETWRAWQQVPAWALGIASIGIALLLVLDEPENHAEAGWAFAIVGLVLAVVLSLRSELSLGSVGDEGNGEPSGTGGESRGSAAENLRSRWRTLMADGLAHRLHVTEPALFTAGVTGVTGFLAQAGPGGIDSLTALGTAASISGVQGLLTRQRVYAPQRRTWR
jgi:hypothetical protein